MLCHSPPSVNAVAVLQQTGNCVRQTSYSITHAKTEKNFSIEIIEKIKCADLKSIQNSGK